MTLNRTYIEDLMYGRKKSLFTGCLLGVVSGLYGFLVVVRSLLYAVGILRRRKVGQRVISVGNITLGGTGKTPAVIAICCATLVKLYNPRTMLITGPAAIFGEMLTEPIWLRVRQHVMPEMLADLRIGFVPWTEADEALGAALIAERSYWRTAGA